MVEIHEKYYYRQVLTLFECLPPFEWVSESHSVMSDSLQPRGLLATRFLRPWDFPGQSTGVGSLSLLQGSNLGLLHCRQLYHLSHQGRWLEVTTGLAGNYLLLRMTKNVFSSDNRRNKYWYINTSEKDTLVIDLWDLSSLTRIEPRSQTAKP